MNIVRLSCRVRRRVRVAIPTPCSFIRCNKAAGQTAPFSMEEQLPSKRHLSTKELSTRLGVSVKTIEAWRYRGEGPAYVKFGRLVRYDIETVEAFERDSIEPRFKTDLDPGAAK